MVEPEQWQDLGRRLWTRMLLRACDVVGAEAELRGRPRIVNQGRILIGKRFRFSSEPVMSHLLAERGALIEIGDDVSIGHGSGIAARSKIRIGKGSRLGAYTLAMDTDYHVPGDHVPGLSNSQAEVCPIEIGEGVHIGNRVTILCGTTIGDGATVLDGSVVSGGVPAGAHVAGVPARAKGSHHRSESEQLNEGVELRVCRVAQETFRLAELPALSLGPSKVEAWDSLGTLSLLLALEEEFMIPLGEDQMREVRSLFDASTVISMALELA